MRKIRTELIQGQRNIERNRWRDSITKTGAPPASSRSRSGMSSSKIQSIRTADMTRSADVPTAMPSALRMAVLRLAVCSSLSGCMELPILWFGLLRHFDVELDFENDGTGLVFFVSIFLAAILLSSAVCWLWKRWLYRQRQADD